MTRSRNPKGEEVDPSCLDSAAKAMTLSPDPRAPLGSTAREPLGPTDAPSVLRPLVPSRWIFTCFFLSGFSALIYEVAWLSRIQLVMGHTVYSLATTVSAYLAGLAWGALWVPRLRRSGIDPLWLYLGAELGVGIYGVFFSPLVALWKAPYGALVTALPTLPLPVISAVQFVFCGALVALPTFLMGTTLPLLADYLYRRPNEISEKTPALYGVNTLGAMTGAFGAGYLILPALGYDRSILLAAGINLSLFLIITVISGGEAKMPPWRAWREGLTRTLRARREEPAAWGVLRAADWPAVVALFVSGFVSLELQMVWNRLAALGFGPSVYVFPLITTIVLAGIGLGSLLFRRIAARERMAGLALAFLPAAGGLAVLGGTAFFATAPKLTLWVHMGAPGFWSYTFWQFLWAAATLLPAAMLTGAIFPAAATALTRGRERDEATAALSAGYAVNIAGLIVGGVAGSFVLLPGLGIESLIQFTTYGLLGLSAYVALTRHWLPAAAIAVWVLGWIAVEVTPAWDWQRLTAGYFYNRFHKMENVKLRNLGWANQWEYSQSNETVLIDRRDDPHATVSIHGMSGKQGYRAFKINGKVDGNNDADLGTTRLLAFLPALIRSDYQNAVVIGLGTGSTAANVLRYPQMKSVEVVELSSAMVHFSQTYFKGTDGDIWDDPRFRLENRDGRDFLEHTRSRFDLIVSEPSNPWVDGVASLFTREFFDTVSRRLSPAGVAMIWFHSYALTCDTVWPVLVAAAEAFKGLLVLRVSGDLYILGSNDPELRVQQVVPENAFMEKGLMKEAGVYRSREDSTYTVYKKLLENRLLYDRAGLVKGMVAVEANTDDNQSLQYRSGRVFFSGIGCDTYREAFDADLLTRQLGGAFQVGGTGL